MNKELSLQDKLYIEDLKKQNENNYWKKRDFYRSKGINYVYLFLSYISTLSIIAMSNSYSLEPKFISNGFILCLNVIVVFLTIIIGFNEDSKMSKVDEDFKNSSDKLEKLNIKTFYK